MGTELNSLIKLDQVSKHYYMPESEVELASLTRYEKVYTKILETAEEGAIEAARDVADQIQRNVAEKGRCVIGFGAGRDALRVYDELVKLYFADKVSFTNVVGFNLGEFGTGAVSDNEQSTLQRIKERLFNKVDMIPENIHTFDTQATKENVHRLCKLYETEIDEYGGLDLVICQLTKNGGIVSQCAVKDGSQITMILILIVPTGAAEQRNPYACRRIVSMRGGTRHCRDIGYL